MKRFNQSHYELIQDRFPAISKGVFKVLCIYLIPLPKLFTNRLSVLAWEWLNHHSGVFTPALELLLALLGPEGQYWRLSPTDWGVLCVPSRGSIKGSCRSCPGALGFSYAVFPFGTTSAPQVFATSCSSSCTIHKRRKIQPDSDLLFS